MAARAPGDQADHRPPGGRPRRGAAARHRVRPRLDPCLGPTLSAVYSLAFSEATATRGALLSVAYCIGLGVPFVLVALGARWAVGATSFLRRHARSVTRFGGAVLVLVGLLLLTGAWTEMMGWLRSWLAATGFAETAL
ncbi:cytochrome c biogenesis protein CcdA [Blastococcus brunescens]|uniref:Cytochrome c biogenesis protein CcdA n=1 Tax=Blastococcus brunescens TaxID=1564165 RepID=A0ABZ1BAB1_9ACTN|nr:cytochrome c biogenesis protein CcdA [Blastococcus sp. BMG 8361]WRL67161.1 cytochrome c biogenesis protein CcdA [Blastococcus sp. BMG 8361]